MSNSLDVKLSFTAFLYLVPSTVGLRLEPLCSCFVCGLCLAGIDIGTKGFRFDGADELGRGPDSSGSDRTFLCLSPPRCFRTSILSWFGIGDGLDV